MSASTPLGARTTLAIATVLVFVAGFGASLMLAERGSGRSSGTAISAETERSLATSQARTAAVLERLEAAMTELAARETAADSLRAPLGAPLPRSHGPIEGDVGAELVASLDELRKSLESVAARGPTGAPPEERDLQEIARATLGPDWIQLQGLEEQWRADPTATSRSQHLQAARDLIARHGPPSAIYRPRRGGMQFVYRQHEEGEAGTAWYFQLLDGIVVEFFVEDEERDEGG